MTSPVAFGFASLGCACVVIGVRVWSRRNETTQHDDRLVGGGRWGHASNWLRVRGTAIAFVAIGITLLFIAAGGLVA